MNRMLLAVLLAATPAFAHRHEREYDEDRQDGQSWQGSDDRSGAYGDERYDWSVPDDDEEGWQPSDGDDSGYAAARGPSYDDFRNDAELSWNGEWIQTPEYGTVWRPRRVRDDWQPYVYGRWVWTDAGWAWASDEPFGWAVYHYGRWAWSPAAGWMWVPGRIWAPAWVSWRWTDGYAAWCPMGPRSTIVEQPSLWVVVPTRHFLEPVPHYVVPRPQRRVFAVPSGSAARVGPAVTVIERATGRAVRPLAIGDARTPASARAGSASVIFYRPRTAPIAAPPRSGQPGALPPNPRQPGALPPNPRPVQQMPRAVADSPRPIWSGPSSPAADQPRPQAIPAQQRPPNAPLAPPKATAPHAAAPAAVRPAAVAPHETVPVARSTPEQPQAKER
ncbi:MAG: hypothetical protein AUG04_11655 [Deltaproteobacteria bacterium 13_1_20CM_2_69_21]|nr:MAG: hypothetical protein AUH38_00755 [Deltaproteobacteria bacterium 13_1_40CM_68_24]OLD10323.1 MAG: hypothetical protein AUI90_01215 [Deltaproteobacteria bacterium 13_1_40CM_3_69_14]OLE62108.1 MAG: hypothetical protein AUG04_11655 [Deltaproteobacteria bacterium 13_1_20CM_2_69_21]